MRTIKSENAIQTDVRLDAAKKGCTLWRNNVGVLTNERGVPIRFGLANDSKAVNKLHKSSDLIGIKKVIITQEMVGATIGQFVAREIKNEGWIYSNTPRELAQLRWLKLILSLGGDAGFATGKGTL